MSERLKHWVVVASGILGFVIPTYFAWTLYVTHVPQNIATWGMVFALDALGLILVYKDGNKKPFLQIGWAVAMCCVFLAVILNGNQMVWGRTEIISVILCVVAIILWITMSARKALWAYIAAMYISFIPLAVDYWNKPQPDTLWLWLWTIVTCLLAILGAEKRNFAYTFVPWAVIGLDAIIVVLCVL